MIWGKSYEVRKLIEDPPQAHLERHNLPRFPIPHLLHCTTRSFAQPFQSLIVRRIEFPAMITRGISHDLHQIRMIPARYATTPRSILRCRFAYRAFVRLSVLLGRDSHFTQGVCEVRWHVGYCFFVDLGLIRALTDSLAVSTVGGVCHGCMETAIVCRGVLIILLSVRILTDRREIQRKRWRFPAAHPTRLERSRRCKSWT